MPVIKNGDIFRLMARDLEKAQVMAINKASATTLARMKDNITSRYNIKRKDVTSHTQLSKANKNLHIAKIVVPHKPLGLIYFSARDLKRSGGGVSYSLLKGRRLVRPHAFVLNVNKEGARQVFQRYGPKVRKQVKLNNGKVGIRNQQHIKKVVGLSVSVMFLGKRGKKMQEELGKTFSEQMQKELVRACKYITSK